MYDDSVEHLFYQSKWENYKHIHCIYTVPFGLQYLMASGVLSDKQGRCNANSCASRLSKVHFYLKQIHEKLIT